MAEKKKMSQKVDKRRRAYIDIPGAGRIWFSGKTNEELAMKKAQAREKYIEGTANKDMTFHALVSEWWIVDKLPRFKAESTMLQYRSILDNYIYPFFPKVQMARAVSYKDLQRCIDQVDGKNKSLGIHLRSAIKSIYQYAVANRYVMTDIAAGLKLPTFKEAKEKDFLTEDQTRRLLQAAATEKYGITIYLLYYLGLRRGEMLGLRWGDIDWTTNMIHIQRSVVVNSKISEGKTKSANRYVPIPSPLRNVLRPIRGLPTEYIVQNPESPHEGHMMSASTFISKWNLMMYHAGLAHVNDDFEEKNAKRMAAGKEPLRAWDKSQIVVEITPHWLRHNYVSILYDAGIDPVTATRIVGHSSYQTTADVYTHISEMRKKKAALSIDHVFSNVANSLPEASGSRFY